MRTAALLAMLPLACLCAAQSTANTSFTINGFTNRLPAKNAWEASGDIRFFNGDEKNTYGSLRVIAGVADRTAVSFAGSFADKKTVIGNGGIGIRTGGSDLEIQIAQSFKELPGLAIMGGISAPGTPRQSDAFFTAGAIYGSPFKQGTAYVGAKGAFRSDSGLSGIVVGAEYDFDRDWSFVGEFDGVISGENTYDLNGNARRVSTYAAGVRYRTTDKKTLVTLGVTNALGTTTGFSLTPGLNNSMAVYLGVSVRR